MLFLHKLSQEMILHGSWETQGTISKKECGKMRQTSISEIPKEESLQAEFKNCQIWPNNTETRRTSEHPVVKGLSIQKTLEIIMSHFIPSFLTTSISRIQNVPITVSLRPSLDVRVSFQSPDGGWVDVIRHQSEDLTWKERRVYSARLYKGMFLIQDWRIIQF